MPEEVRTTDVQVIPGEGVTLQEQIYAERRAEGMTKAAAARAAGFDDSLVDHAYRIEARMPVRQLIAKLRKEARERTGVTVDDIIQGFKDSIAVASTAGEMIAGYREMGKLLGLYEQAALEIKVQHEDKGSEKDVTPERLGSLPTKKLLELSGELIEDADWDEILQEAEDNG